MTDKQFEEHLRNNIMLPFDFNKSIIQELEWRDMKCSICGTKLSEPVEIDIGEYKTCPKCGNRHLLVRRLKDD